MQASIVIAKACFLAAWLLEASATRKVFKHKAEVGSLAPKAAEGEPGQVDYLFTLGAPGTASPALQNRRGSSPCFKGFRVWLSNENVLFPDTVDWCTQVANIKGLHHAWMPSMNINIDGDEGHERQDRPCNLEETWQPDMDWGTSLELHWRGYYINAVDQVMSHYHSNLSKFIGNFSYWHNITALISIVESMGWGLVATAHHPGNEDKHQEEQVAHLLQHPTSLECVLTFQGTGGTLDGWLTDAHFFPDRFCGLEDEDEDDCPAIRVPPPSPCPVKNPRSSFVHSGFRNRLLAMMSTQGFRSIKRSLPSCAKLTVGGHSLGAAVSELFTACASNAPQEGEYGYEDYRNMSWRKGVPKKLPLIRECDPSIHDEC